MRSRQRVKLTLRKYINKRASETCAREKPDIEQRETKTRAMKKNDVATMY